MNGYTTRWSANVIQPYQNPDFARRDAVAIAASQVIAAGTLLGEVGNVSAVSTITISTGTSGGSFKLTTTLAPVLAQTGAISWNGTNATLLSNIQAALNTSYGTTGGSPNVLASAGTLTAGIGTVLLTAQNAFGGQPITWTLQDSTTGGTGTTIASTTTGVLGSGGFKAYSSTATDGSQIPKCILELDVETDASGNVTFSTTTNGGEGGITQTTAPVFTGGYFAVADIIGLDQNAINVLNGRSVRGGTGASVTAGVFVF